MMATALVSKPQTERIDWINPDSEKVTLEEYQNEMQEAENSGFIDFEEHKKNMNAWLTAKL
ncbi:MAG: hypothetical protein LBE56_04065 [Tannerella sp.]|jgi:hypothetical protein|nr:hypothetical protein [Tannerella sp.]